MPFDYLQYDFANATTATNTTDWLTAPLATTNICVDANGIKYTTYLTKDDLDNFCKKIYEIISSYTQIDITEEEFMTLMKE